MRFRMAASWMHTRAEIARAVKKDPNADVSDLKAKLREEVAAEKVRKMAEELSADQRLRVARILTETLNCGGGSQQ
ncbi:hypothetical protein [Micromonospora aurantiaca (nom. illeg.)]|uniref:hypothetical protein n=1 Tax=Micromonospora aurantiaca (nom. illeg.) TaxID=47850 RepID=UPI00367EA475